MPRGFNKVFGIGLSRTATRSLSFALQELGIPTIHFPSDQRTFDQLSSGDYALSVLAEAGAITDTPAAAFFAQLDTAFPGSRFVLTVRNPSAWLASCEKLWRYTTAAQRTPYHRFINGAVYGTWEFTAERFRYVYQRHLNEVREFFRDRPGDLLELDICAGQGWEPLCQFLDLPRPPVPFPHRDLLVPGG
ncbi:MAG: hypothetical protein M3Z06_09990 [Actinomycetota bacterium]|nr:hypothetical protein [Actinomycetota bacterium]